jgi:hypothetical protein
MKQTRLRVKRTNGRERLIHNTWYLFSCERITSGLMASESPDRAARLNRMIGAYVSLKKGIPMRLATPATTSK